MQATVDDTHRTTRQRSSLAGKYLTFSLGQEEYGLPVVKVREIIKVMDITFVPQMPAHVRGVINLRGQVIPVIDLRRTLGLPSREHTDRTCIIVVQVDVEPTTVMLGIVVDSVLEVLHVAQADIDQAPVLRGQVTTDALLGLAKVKGAVKILLDLDRVLGGDGAIALPGA